MTVILNFFDGISTDKCVTCLKVFLPSSESMSCCQYSLISFPYYPISFYEF